MVQVMPWLWSENIDSIEILTTMDCRRGARLGTN